MEDVVGGGVCPEAGAGAGEQGQLGMERLGDSPFFSPRPGTILGGTTPSGPWVWDESHTHTRVMGWSSFGLNPWGRPCPGSPGAQGQRLQWVKHQNGEKLNWIRGSPAPCITSVRAPTPCHWSGP